MIEAARFIDQHRAAASATFRRLFGVSIHQIGTPELRWGEAIDLLAVAAGDSGTWLAAEVHGLKYPARPVENLIAKAVGSIAFENIDDLLPFPRQDDNRVPTPDEYREATARMLADWGIDDPAFEDAVRRHKEIYERKEGERCG